MQFVTQSGIKIDLKREEGESSEYSLIINREPPSIKSHVITIGLNEYELVKIINGFNKELTKKSLSKEKKERIE